MTRVVRVDAILVALTREPALEGVKTELDLTWRVQRVRLADGDIAVVSPLDDQMEPFVVRRAFDLARSRKAKVAAVGDGPTWSTFVSWEADRHPGVEVERLSLSEALPRLMNAPDGFCVVVTQRQHAELVSDPRAVRLVGADRLGVVSFGDVSPHHESVRGLPVGVGVDRGERGVQGRCVLAGVEKGLGRSL